LGRSTRVVEGESVTFLTRTHWLSRSSTAFAGDTTRDMGIVPEHAGADVAHPCLNHAKRNAQFDHVRDKRVPEVVKPEVL
jgi:hypothetical protein